MDHRIHEEDQVLRYSASNLYTALGHIQSDKIAGFDLGWTLIRPIRSTHHLDENDWAFLPNRIETLKIYQDHDYTIAIFTNQSSKHKSIHAILRMIQNVIKALNNHNIHPWVFVSTKHDQVFNKPYQGMWNELTKYMLPDLTSSFLTGDTAGRRYDSSDNDRLFAKNVGIAFYEPEEIFPVNNPFDQQAHFDVILLMGMPNSGKDEYYFKHLSSTYTHTQDPKIANMLLELREPLVINLTSSSFDDRRRYITLARQYNASCVILYFVRNGYRWNKYMGNLYTHKEYNDYFNMLSEPSEMLDKVSVIQIDRV